MTVSRCFCSYLLFSQVPICKMYGHLGNNSKFLNITTLHLYIRKMHIKIVYESHTTLGHIVSHQVDSHDFFYVSFKSHFVPDYKCDRFFADSVVCYDGLLAHL